MLLAARAVHDTGTVYIYMYCTPTVFPLPLEGVWWGIKTLKKELTARRLVCFSAPVKKSVGVGSGTTLVVLVRHAHLP